MTQPYPPPMPSFGPYPGGPQNPPGPVPLDKPCYGISFGGAIKRFFTKYATFSGRASRSEYWFAQLFLFIALVVGVGLVILSQGTTGGFEQGDDPTPVFLVLVGLFVLAVLAVIVPSIAISVRRLHDANMSGWMYLLSLIPYVGGIVLIVLMCQGTKPEGMRFDADFVPYGYPPYGGPQYGVPGYPPPGYPQAPGYPPAPGYPGQSWPPADPGQQPPAPPPYGQAPQA